MVGTPGLRDYGKVGILICLVRSSINKSIIVSINRKVMREPMQKLAIGGGEPIADVDRASSETLICELEQIQQRLGFENGMEDWL